MDPLIQSNEQPERIVWLNGAYLPVTEAHISPFDRGFLYGDGVFETVRGDYGAPLYLANHIARLVSAAELLKMTVDAGYDWKEVFRQILIRNRYTDRVARMKIIASRGIHHGLDLRETDSPTILVYANTYTIPEKKYRHGWKLHMVRDGYAPRLAKIKSLNYLYYLYIRQQAIDAHCDDALIMDEREQATETATGSLMFRTNGEWWIPSAEYQLQGLARSHVISILKEQGHNVEQRDATIAAMLSAETIWVLNSMIGIIPITEVSGYPVKEPMFEEAAKLRSLLFSRGKQDALYLLTNKK